MTVTKRPRILLAIGPGTLPSQGSDRMDFTSYNTRLSGKPPLTGREMVAALPEIDAVAEIVFDDAGPHPQGTDEDIRKLARFLDTEARRDDIDGIVWGAGDQHAGRDGLLSQSDGALGKTVGGGRRAASLYRA